MECLGIFARVNKSQMFAYNKFVNEIIVSERLGRSGFITYIYNSLSEPLLKTGGRGELLLSEERAVLRIVLSKEKEEITELTRELVAEVLGIGYKFAFLQKKLSVCLPRREKKHLSSALIAADFESDKVFIKRRLQGAKEYTLDGFYHFRLGGLREKWAKIINYIPESFSTTDLKRFCEFLVGESRRKIYVKGKYVFGENFMPLRRSRLTGEEDTETEIMLSDAGFVYCLGKVEQPLEDFLQKYYAERAVFS